MPPTTPELTGPVYVAENTDDLYDALASRLFQAAIDAVRQRGVFHLALSGGSTPEPFYIRLMIDSRYRALPWMHTHLWLVDERHVPLTDERSNWKMIRECIVEQVPTPKRQTHPAPVQSKDPAGDYESELKAAFAAYAVPPLATWPEAEAPRLDFVLLGMGDDCHTASLFPGSEAIDVNDRLIAMNAGDAVTPPPRITMTYRLLNAARDVAVLVTGEKKAAAIQRVQQAVIGEDDLDPHALPIVGVNPRPAGGKLTWYLDEAAATPV